MTVDYLCSIPECNLKGYSKWVCKFHYDRKRRLGSYDRPCVSCGKDLGGAKGNVKYCSQSCVPICRVDMCHGKIVDKHGLCRYHKVNMQRWGKVTPKYTISEVRKSCRICDAPVVEEWGRRGFCSNRCYERFRAYGIDSHDASFNCERCGTVVEVDLRVPGETMLRKVCSGCVSQKYRPGWQSAKSHFRLTASKSDCGICGETIDYSLKWPDNMSPSVDHIIPVALGGGHDTSNLQYAHLLCNSIKGARLGFTINEGVAV